MRRLKKALKKAKETTGMNSMPSFMHVGVEMNPKDADRYWDMEKRIQFMTRQIEIESIDAGKHQIFKAISKLKSDMLSPDRIEQLTQKILDLKPQKNIDVFNIVHEWTSMLGHAYRDPQMADKLERDVMRAIGSLWRQQ